MEQLLQCEESAEEVRGGRQRPRAGRARGHGGATARSITRGGGIHGDAAVGCAVVRMGWTPPVGRKRQQLRGVAHGVGDGASLSRSLWKGKDNVGPTGHASSAKCGGSGGGDRPGEGKRFPSVKHKNILFSQVLIYQMDDARALDISV
jgi:hypothetical protein